MNSSTECPEQLLRENVLLKQENTYLKEQVEWFRRQIFGKRSEKVVEPPADNVIFLPGFGELTRPVVEPRKCAVAAHERKGSTRSGQDAIALPADLPVERKVVDLSEKEKVCVETGLPLTKIGEEVTKKIAYRPGSYFIKETVRLKYALPHGSSGGIRIAPLPESLLDRCQADESLLADIMVRKYADHLPLHRISEIFARDGIGISRQTLCKWILRAGHALKPLYDEMKKCVLASGNVFVDETPLKMLEGNNGKTQQAFMWMIAGGKDANPSYRIYAFRTNRSHIHAEALLKDYEGILHSDKYGAYEKMAQKKQIVWCPCWAHVRRKFVEAEAGDPKFRDWVLRKIRYLFIFEKIAWSRSPEERVRIRKEKESRIIDELIQAVQNRLINGQILPKSKFREALGYFCGLIPYLKKYIDDPYARMDNNVAERALRPIALGRKNWLFVGNEQSGEAAATILSLVQTCRALNINPREYLEDVMRRLMSHPAKKLKELLPNEWALSKKSR
jgi:transposase